MYRLAMIVCLVLLPGIVQAEPFTVWETGGWIWGRDEGTGNEWVLSGMATGRDPQVAGYFSAWFDSRLNQWGSGIDAIYLYVFDRRWLFLGEDRMYYSSHYPLSDLAVSAVSTEYGGQYWMAWREQGGVWARYFNRRTPSLVYEPLPNYGGQFSLQADQLLYDGGQVTLVPPVPVPEPGTLALLITGAFGVLLLVWRRRRRTA